MKANFKLNVSVQVPFAVLFGVFLYMGVSGMNGVQFFDRLRLAVMPVKHHPQVTDYSLKTLLNTKEIMHFMISLPLSRLFS